jgi:hypothetical protein
VGGLNPGGALVVRWNGSSWSIAYPDAIGPRTPDPGFLGVWGSSPGDVWAVGPQHPSPLGQIFHWDGSIWSSNATPDSRRGISGTSTNDVWAVGLFYILHWNGSAWTRLTAEESTILNAVWAGSSTDVWAVGEGGTVLHWQ